MGSDDEGNEVAPLLVACSGMVLILTTGSFSESPLSGYRDSDMSPDM